MRTAFALALAGLALGMSARAGAVHDHEGPHKGIVVEWGDEEFHPEIVVDKKDGAVTVYVYGTDKDLAKGKVAPIDAKTLTLTLKTTPPTVVKLEPAAEKTDPAGKSSKFTGKHDVFKQDMKWAGTLSGKVGTKPYSGDFKQK
jgi:hypothetical protein